MSQMPCLLLHISMLHVMNVCYMFIYYIPWMTHHRLHSYLLHAMETYHKSHESIKKYFLHQSCMGYLWQNHYDCLNNSIDNLYKVLLVKSFWLLRVPLLNYSWHNHSNCQNISIKTITRYSSVIILIVRISLLKYSWRNYFNYSSISDRIHWA